MIKALIYQPSKTAMQSGRRSDSVWRLEYRGLLDGSPDSLMGWSQTGDTLSQVHIDFDTQESAESYAKKHNLQYSIRNSQKRKIMPKNYVDNFRYIEEKRT